MKNNILKQIVSLFLLFISFANIYSQNGNQQIANLRAFAKLYGYVRFFHPSDESANLNWDKFSIYGTEKVLSAKNDNELKVVLKKLFLPIAPTAQIFSVNEKPVDNNGMIPADVSNYKVTSWQHYGVEINNEPGIYKSARLNCKKEITPTNNSGAAGIFRQALDAKPLRGKEILLTVSVKADVKTIEDKGFAWLRVDRESNQRGFFDNMMNRPITSPVWQEYKITGTVSEDATFLYFGGIVLGSGKVWYDDFKLFYKNEKKEWISVTITNPGFEDDIFTASESSWQYGSQEYKYLPDIKEFKSGSRSILITTDKITGAKYEIPQKLFDKEAKIGEIFEWKFSVGLMCRIPLALYCDTLGTFGKNKEYQLSSILPEIEKIQASAMKGDNLYVRLGNAITAWNVFQHFYPYFDVVKVDWDKVLTETLGSALLDKTADDFFDTLRKMVSKLEDGHGVVYYQPVKPAGGFPIKAEWIENNVVITASTDPNFRKGDIIKKIDGKTGEKALLDAEEFVSGAPQLQRYRALNQFGQGPVGSIADIEIVRNGEIINVKAERKPDTRNLFFNAITEFSFPSLKKIEEGIYYINMRISQKEFNENLEQLSNAKGVIIDWRWDGKYDPNVKSITPIDIVAYLADTVVQSAKWNIPNVIYPDRKEMEFALSGWPLPPKKPHFKGMAVFIDEPSVVSYGETCMGIVENYKLAETVGEPTAGTNGNVNFINLPGGYRIMWTGMKVLKHDGSQHHLIGIQPSYPVKKTIKAVIEGRDEYVEKAVEVIKNSAKKQ